MCPKGGYAGARQEECVGRMVSQSAGRVAVVWQAVAGTMNKGMTLDACGQWFHAFGMLGRLVYGAPGPTDWQGKAPLHWGPVGLSDLRNSRCRLACRPAYPCWCHAGVGRKEPRVAKVLV